MLDLLEASLKHIMNNTTSARALEISIPSDTTAARQIQEDVEQALLDQQYEERERFGIRLALEEALVNAIKHGNQLDNSKKVHVRCRISPERCDIHIRDEGPGFNPEAVPNPMDPENLERDCGRGLLLMRHYMTEVVFHTPGNAVTMCKIRSTHNGPSNGR